MIFNRKKNRKKKRPDGKRSTTKVEAAVFDTLSEALNDLNSAIQRVTKQATR